MKREGGGEEETGRREREMVRGSERGGSRREGGEREKREREKEGKREGEGVIHIYPKIRSIMVNT